MRVLVTGASGWVGKSLCRRLKVDGMELRRAVRSNLSGDDQSDQVVIGEIDGASYWQPVLRSVDVVVHLAARVHVMRECAIDPISQYRKVNQQGTLHLAREAAALGVKRFVFVSSVKVNAELSPVGRPLTETDSPDPQDAYAISKLEAELGLLQIAETTGMQVVVIRPPLVYGPGVKANFGSLLHAVKAGWLLPLGSINNKRSLIALDNLVDFIAVCVTHTAAANQTFFVSDGCDLSTPQLVRALASAAGRACRLVPVPVWLLRVFGSLVGRADAVQRLCGNLQIDSSKARLLLNWTPPISVSEGMQRAVQDGCER
jgi:nucleoside-diphosphate-sugar epimerase